MEAAKQITYSNNPIGVPQTVREFTETIIGTTFYDLQTNNAISDRLIYNSGTGTISATWPCRRMPVQVRQTVVPVIIF